MIRLMGQSEKDEIKINLTKAPGCGDTSPRETPAAQGYDAPGEPRKKSRKGWIIGALVLFVIAAVLIAGRALRIRRSASGTPSYTLHTVSRGDITVTLSGSGTLEPADSYTVTSLISGDIISAPFEEGETVGKGQVLYDVYSSDIESSVKQAENNLKDSEHNLGIALRQLDSLKPKAGGSGSVVELNVEAGDAVQAGQTIASIRDSDTMSVTALFQKAVAESFYVGQDAVVTLGGTYESYNGTVTKIGTVDHILTGNVIAREVTVDVANPGAFTPSTTGYLTINGTSSLQNGTFDYKYQGTVVAASSGTVSKVNVAEGSRVTKGEVIAVLQNDTVDQQVQSARSAVANAKLALEAQQKKLDEYTVRSPIAGTIVEKKYKKGDTLRAGEILCTIFDLSHLSLVLNVDELDIKKVQPGQKVTLTADAAKGTEYTGVVTKVNIKGTTQNGVTSYPVTIRIDNTEGLLPGMNVDARIVVEDLHDVLLVPVGAVMRNNFVLLQVQGQDPETAEPGIPAGFVQTEVTLGASNDAYIVITGGLKEGDIIAITDNTPASYDYSPFARPQNRAENPGGAPPQPAAGVSQ